METFGVTAKMIPSDHPGTLRNEGPDLWPGEHKTFLIQQATV